VLEFANKIYLQNGFKLVQEYKQMLTKDFQSDIEATNFLKPEEAAYHINSWVSSVTHNRVNSLFVPGRITSPSPVSVEVWAKYQTTQTPTVT
jgi:serine protease inhibitor